MISFSKSMIAAMTVDDLIAIHHQCIEMDDHSTCFSIAFDLIMARDELKHELAQLYELTQQLNAKEQA